MNNTSVLTSDSKFVLRSYLRKNLNKEGTLLKLETDNHLTVTGKDSVVENPSVEFYVDRTINAREQLVYRFRPVTQPDKYIAVSGTSIVLKVSYTITNNSHSFIVVEQNNDYTKFQSVLSLSQKPMFLTADEKGEVFLAADSTNDLRRAWFNISERIVKEEVNIFGVVELTTLSVAEE